ncbi:hypothetical protein, partial [Dermacoccus nishinomiyaensis]|uniref:hypothetical protein n=1 Tax=Dermacoccus nishinomiyaensis TaxID=1274 RepID=UPI001C92C6B5
RHLVEAEVGGVGGDEGGEGELVVEEVGGERREGMLDVGVEGVDVGWMDGDGGELEVEGEGLGWGGEEEGEVDDEVEGGVRVGFGVSEVVVLREER